MFKHLCDECGKSATTIFELATGRVLIDGQDVGPTLSILKIKKE